MQINDLIYDDNLSDNVLLHISNNIGVVEAFQWHISTKGINSVEEFRQMYSECFSSILSTKVTDISKIGTFTTYYLVKVPLKDGKIVTTEVYGGLMGYSKKQHAYVVNVSVNFYSDYVWSGLSKKYLDFSGFASENRIQFNNLLAKFIRSIEGEVKMTLPTKHTQSNEISHFAEEIDELGFKSCIERRELLENQNSDKGSNWIKKLFK